jgi:hypothetical protein
MRIFMKTTVTLRLVFTRMPAVPGQLVGSTASCLTESLRGQPSVAVRLAEKPHLRGKKPRDRVAKKASFRGRPGRSKSQNQLQVLSTSSPTDQ